MLHRAVFLLLVQSIGALSIFQGTARKQGEYANVRSEVQFSPTDDGMVLGDMDEIHSMHRCTRQCMLNEMCRTVTYYEDSKSCRLFSAGSSQGNITSRAKAKVIDFIERMLSGIWYPTENMTSPRGYARGAFVATMNSVEIIGGSDGSSNLSSTETFFISNGSFHRRTDLLAKRNRHTADYLNNHTIIIAGGVSAFGTAEIYDPLLGMSNGLINMSALRAWHTSSVIDEGKNSTMKLLLTGGYNQTHILASGDVFNIETNNFTAVKSNMMSPRSYHTATAIGNGYVLLIGGTNASMKLDTLELYNSSSNKFISLSSTMSTTRAHHTATYIPSIQAVLIVGGWSMSGPLQTYDLFNVSTFSFTVLNGTNLNARAFHTATLLSDHQVLIVGGLNAQRLSSCELYDSVTNKFTAVTNMSVERADHTATLLANTGQVLICGGQNSNNMTLNSCELYQP